MDYNGSEGDYLEQAALIVAESQHALTQLGETLREVSSRRHDMNTDEMRLRASALVEAARAIRALVDELCHVLSADALDRGVAPRTLDWSDGTATGE